MGLLFPADLGRQSDDFCWILEAFFLGKAKDGYPKRLTEMRTVEASIARMGCTTLPWNLLRRTEPVYSLSAADGQRLFTSPRLTGVYDLAWSKDSRKFAVVAQSKQVSVYRDILTSIPSGELQVPSLVREIVGVTCHYTSNSGPQPPLRVRAITCALR